MSLLEELQCGSQYLFNDPSIFSSFDSINWENMLSPKNNTNPDITSNTTQRLDSQACSLTPNPNFSVAPSLNVNYSSPETSYKSFSAYPTQSISKQAVTPKWKQNQGVSPKAILVPKKQLPTSKFTLHQVSCDKEFTNRVVIHFKTNGVVPFYCELCDCQSYASKKGSKVTVTCSHYVACNECRGRSIRRILRCVECCEEISGTFPVCNEENCISISDKEPVNTGLCPLCRRKLKKELCSDTCKRRKTSSYTRFRKELNGVIVELVRNPETMNPDSVWRPCPHYSFCPYHNVICKGHGKYSACMDCKNQIRANGISPPLKRSCTSHI